MSSQRLRRSPPKLRDAILEQFEPDIASSLVEFGKSLPKIDADVLVFMARKSLCLYDVLLALGLPPIERSVVSDRVLDLSLTPLKGKRVALIDDTVIVGTTLAKAKQRLVQEGCAKVSVHTFCVDTTWWRKSLIEPDSLSLQLDHDRVMTFCTGEVRALSLLPRPYLVDFPLSLQLRLGLQDLQSLLSSVEWLSFKTSTLLQESHQVATYSFLPTDSITAELDDGLGSDITKCVEIAKVRAFLRRRHDLYWLQIVPILTLKPLTTNDLSRLLQTLIMRVALQSGKNLTKLLDAVVTAKSQQRLAQYVLSVALGHRFLRSLVAITGGTIRPNYDNRESDRHYGPWLHNDMEQINKHAYAAIWETKAASSRIDPVAFSPAQLPTNVEQWSLDTIRAARRGRARIAFRGNDRTASSTWSPHLQRYSWAFTIGANCPQGRRHNDWAFGCSTQSHTRHPIGTAWRLASRGMCLLSASQQTWR